MSSEELAYILAGATLLYSSGALIAFLVLVPRYLRRIADALEYLIQRRKRG